MATISTAVERSGLASGDAETYLRRRRALLVDDDAAIRLICSLNLRGAEFEAAEAADGPRALEQAMRHLPDLVLSDLRMPGLDPFALAEALRRDLDRATAMARQMVTRLGMSEKLGPRVFGSDPHQPFLGRELGAEPSYSEEMAQEIDEEIYRLIDQAHQRAAKVLIDHQQALHEIAAILIEHETIDKEQFERLLHGEPERNVLAEDTPPKPMARAKPQRKRARKIATEPDARSEAPGRHGGRTRHPA